MFVVAGPRTCGITEFVAKFILQYMQINFFVIFSFISLFAYAVAER